MKTSDWIINIYEKLTDHYKEQKRLYRDAFINEYLKRMKAERLSDGFKSPYNELLDQCDRLCARYKDLLETQRQDYDDLALPY